jgi:hypothetical protein
MFKSLFLAVVRILQNTFFILAFQIVVVVVVIIIIIISRANEDNDAACSFSYLCLPSFSDAVQIAFFSRGTGDTCVVKRRC